MPFIQIGDESHSVGPGVLTIGDGSEASWRIQGHGLHPVHLIVVPEPDGRASIVQGGPDAHVVVNGALLEGGWHPLQPGDEIRIGDLVARFRDVSPEAERSAEGYLRDVRRGRVYRIGARSRIGRDLRSEVLLGEPDVSRDHAEIVLEDGRFVLHPRGGVTLVNGRTLAGPAALQEGDEIVAGRTRLRFSRDVPRAVGGEGAGGRPDSRISRMRTTFMGTVEMHDHLRRDSRRRLGRAAMIAAAAVAAIAGLVALWGAAPASAAAAGPAITAAVPALGS